MSSSSYSSTGGIIGGTEVEYPCNIGKIHWENKEINAFLIGGLPIDGDLEISSAILVNYLLAENHDLSEERWAAFVKMSLHLPGSREWKVIGSGVGKQSLPPGELWEGKIPEDIINQLENIFRT